MKHPILLLPLFVGAASCQSFTPATGGSSSAPVGQSAAAGSSANGIDWEAKSIEVTGRLLRQVGITADPSVSFVSNDWAREQAGAEPATFSFAGEWISEEDEETMSLTQDGNIVEQAGALLWGVDGDVAQTVLPHFIGKDELEPPLAFGASVKRITARPEGDDTIVRTTHVAMLFMFEDGTWMDEVTEAKQDERFRRVR